MQCPSPWRASAQDLAAFRRDGFLRKDVDAMTTVEILELLRAVSGEDVLGIPDTVEWVRRVTTHEAGDPQYEKHVDNVVGPIFKVWLYPAETTLADGPLHYIRGSHRAAGEGAEAKLRWLHESTQPPATEAMREPALRMRGDEIEHGFAQPQPLLPLPGVRRTLVLADTSGIHFRGNATAGHVRVAWRMAGDNDGGLPRLDPFRAAEPPSCPQAASG